MDRLTFAFTVATGYKVEVQTASGFVYEGIFHAANYNPSTDSSNHGIVLKYARVVKDPTVLHDKDGLAERPAKTKRIKAADLVQMVAKDVRMNPEDLAGDHEDLETDAAISRGRGGQFGRELQRWVGEEDDSTTFLSLEDSAGTWDQFEVNKTRFGVTSTYNENLYTTVLDKNRCGISETDAARIAREIEQGVGNMGSGLAAYHMMEERGMEINDAMDEEDRYGAVVRDRPAAAPQNASNHSSQDGRSNAASWRQQPPQQRGNGTAAAPSLAKPIAGAAGGVAPPPPPPRAWGGAGAGVAVLSGRLSTGGPAPALGPRVSQGAPLPPTVVTTTPIANAIPQPIAAAAAAINAPDAAPLQPAVPTATAAIAVPGAEKREKRPSSGGGSGTQVPVAGEKARVPSVPVNIPTAAASQHMATPGEDALRKETNKVRNQVMGIQRPAARVPGSGGGSRSPLSSSPLINDGIQLMALNLDAPGPNRNPPDIRQEYGRWVVKDRQKKELAESQKRLESFKAMRDSNQASGSMNGSVSASLSAAPTASSIGSEAIPAVSGPSDSKQAAPAAAAAAAAASTGEAAPPVAAAAETAAPAAAATSTAAAATAGATTAAPPAKKSSLNPFAKAFTLSIDAKPFVPTSTPATTNAATNTARVASTGSVSAVPVAASAPVAVPVANAAPAMSSSGSTTGHVSTVHSSTTHSPLPKALPQPHVHHIPAAGLTPSHQMGMHVPGNLHGALHHTHGSSEHLPNHSHAHGHGVMPPASNDGAVNIVHAPTGGVRMAPANMHPVSGGAGHADNAATGPHAMQVALGPATVSPSLPPMQIPTAAGVQYMIAAPYGQPHGMQAAQAAQGGPMQLNPAGAMLPGPQTVVYAHPSAQGASMAMRPPTGAQGPMVMMQPGISPAQGQMFAGQAGMFMASPQGYGYPAMPGQGPSYVQLQPGMAGMPGMQAGQSIPVPSQHGSMGSMSHHVGSYGSQGADMPHGMRPHNHGGRHHGMNRPNSGRGRGHHMQQEGVQTHHMMQQGHGRAGGWHEA